MPPIDRLLSFAQEQLAPIAQRSGSVLYSGAHTLRKGSIYLLGLNPGGNPETHEDTVGSRLAELRTREHNAYLDESWECRGKPCPKGQSRLQLRVCSLLQELGAAPRDVCASNIIFTRSKGAEGSGYPASADLCWPVHAQILRIVQPKVVIAFGISGVSPYRYLRQRLDARNEQAVASGHGSWSCRTFIGRDGIRVIGLPHLSRYAVNNNPQIAQWARELAL